MRTRTILANTGFNVAGMVVTSLIALAITPLLLRDLGARSFGVWALFGVVVALSQLLDFGLGRALVRNVAQYRMLGRWSVAATDVNSALWPLLGFSAAAALAGWWAAVPIAHLLGVPADLMSQAVPTLRLLTLSLVPVTAGLILSALVEGSQRMAYTSAGTILNRALFALGALAAVTFDIGLVGIAAAYLAGVCAQMLLLLVAARRVAPALRYSPALYDRTWLRRDWTFARFIFATSLIALGYTATNKVLLARWTGVDRVAYYELAVVIATQIFTLALAVAQALYPAYSAAHAGGGMEAVRGLYIRALRLLALLVLPLAGLMIALADPFIRAWFNAPIPEAVSGLQYLAAAWAIAGMASAAAVGMQAIGRPGMAMSFSAYNLVVNFILALLLVPAWGYWGLIAANVAAVSSSAVLTLLFFGRVTGLSRRLWLTAFSPDLLLWTALLAVGLIWVAQRLVQPNLAELFVLGGAYALLYAAGAFVLELLRPDEQAWLRTRLRALLRQRSLTQGTMAP